jgi:hypothetical protein
MGSTSTGGKTKRVTFKGTVNIILIPPVNKLIKKELFYSEADFLEFELEAYLEDMQQARVARQHLEEACRQQEQYLCNSSNSKTKIKMTPITQDRLSAANAA